MTGWNFDLIDIPRDGSFVWIATHRGEVVRSKFVAKSRSIKEPYWSGVGPEACILAWQPFVWPAHPRMTEMELVDALDALVPARLAPGDKVTMSHELASSLGFGTTEFTIDDVGGE